MGMYSKEELNIAVWRLIEFIEEELEKKKEIEDIEELEEIKEKLEILDNLTSTDK